MMAAADPCFRLCAGAVLPWEVTQRQCHDGGTARHHDEPVSSLEASHATPMASTFPASLAVTTPPQIGDFGKEPLWVTTLHVCSAVARHPHNTDLVLIPDVSLARACASRPPLSASVHGSKASPPSLPPVSPYVPGAGESRRNSGGSSCATDE